MQPTQNAPNEIAEIDAAVQAVTHPDDVINALDWRHHSFIDFTALNGLVFDNDASEYQVDDKGKSHAVGAPIRKMTQTELATALGVDRKTLYRWRDSIPNFWNLVGERRKELLGQTWLSKVHETWRMKAIKGDFQHMQLWLANFDPNFRMPTQEIKHDVSDNYTALLAAASRDGIIEGEVVQHAQIDAGTSAENQPAHPSTS
jgi:hypothetical protein